MEIKFRTDLPKLLDYYNLPKVICEIGVAEGLFAQSLYTQELEKLYLIDIWQNIDSLGGCAAYPQQWHDNNYEHNKRLWAGKDNVVMIKGLSYKVADKIPDDSCGLVYVDGDHSYEGVMADLIAYWPKVVEGGIMAFHDYGNTNYGVKDAVVDFFGDDQIELIVEDGDVNNMSCYIIKE